MDDILSKLFGEDDGDCWLDEDSDDEEVYLVFGALIDIFMKVLGRKEEKMGYCCPCCILILLLVDSFCINNNHHNNNSNHHSITGSRIQLIRSANISISNEIWVHFT